jgi:hypothetical protein
MTAPDDFSPLTVADYAVQALTTDQRSDKASLTFPLLGLFGETGSLLKVPGQNVASCRYGP